MTIELSAKLVQCVYLLDDEDFNKILIRSPRPIHETCENYAPRKFGAVQY